MVYRYSWLAGLVALLFAFYGISNLLLPSIDGAPWQFIIVSGTALGVVITWTAVTYRLNTWIVAALNAITMFFAVAQIAAANTTRFLIPTTATFVELDSQLDQTLFTIRNGVEPVLPVTGVVVLVLIVFWTVGALMAWGLTTGHPYVALVPPLVLSLQFATMDRAPTSLARVAAFIVVIAGVILAINLDDRDQTAGRMAQQGHWPSTRNRIAPGAGAILGVTLIASVAVVGVLENRVPRDGVINWRTSTGLTGDFYGSVSYNPFIGIQQRLVSNSSTPVFLAEVTGDVPASEVYFRLVTMETYNGGQFFANQPQMVDLDEVPWENPDHAFDGDQGAVRTEIQIERLRMDWLPAAYTPVATQGPASYEQSVRFRTEDGSLRLDGGQFSYQGMRYQVDSLVPEPDFAVLASTAAGELSPAFQLAADADEAVPTPVTAASLEAITRDEPPNVELYLALPENPDDRIEEIAARARLRTRNLQTDFEKGLALEAWFHTRFTNDPTDPLDGFQYTTDITPGHGASDLAAWLLDPASPNYHQGYCENFATAMAIMARTLGIPSRVVLGFTPGQPHPDQDNVVIVRDRNAHAWVELWMPTQGWVRFDPTPRNLRDTPQTFESVENELGFNLNLYLDVPDPDVTAAGGGSALIPRELDPGAIPFLAAGGGEDASGGGFSVPAWLWFALPALALAVFLFGGVPVVKWWRRRRRLRRLTEGDVTAAWEEIISRLTDLGDQPNPVLTPIEFANEVDESLRPLASVYGRAVYGPVDAIEDHHVSAAQSSLRETTRHIQDRYTRRKRMVALYRPGTVIPRWLRRKRNRG